MQRKSLFALLIVVLLPVVSWAGGHARKQMNKNKSSRQPVLVGLATGGAESSQVWLVGAYQSGRGWRNDKQARFLLYPGTRFVVYNLRGKLGELSVGRVESGEEMGGYMALGRSKLAGTGLALAGASHPAPRLPRAQSLTNPLYQRVVASLLRARGLRVARPRLTQHLRLDLNGDGTDEVLLCAQSRAAMGREPRAVRGDYALAALRFVSKGKVKTVPLGMEVYPRAVKFGAPGRYAVLACADINGDGKLEVVLDSSYYEGWGVEIFTFDGNRVRRVLVAGWGV